MGRRSLALLVLAAALAVASAQQSGVAYWCAAGEYTNIFGTQANPRSFPTTGAGLKSAVCQGGSGTTSPAQFNNGTAFCPGSGCSPTAFDTVPSTCAVSARYHPKFLCGALFSVTFSALFPAQLPRPDSPNN